jgi:hypothetical protein
MKRFQYFFFLFLVLVSCQQAGSEGGKCLEDGTCLNQDLACDYEGKCVHCGESSELCCEGGLCGDGLSCDEWGYCQICGGYGSPCCEGERCEEGYLCGQDNTCTHCGCKGEPCCDDFVCDFSTVCGPNDICVECGQIGLPCCDADAFSQCINSACTPAGICKNQICEEDGQCVECGLSNQPCCEGRTCSSGYVCNDKAVCEGCGYRGYPVCADGTCEGWWQNINGFCENPFKVDPKADLNICEQADEGHSRSQRDWCYWYAAYNKQDITICERIDWDEMKAKCLEMEDPDAHHIIYW